MQEKKLTAKNLVAFNTEDISEKYTEIENLNIRKNATRKQVMQDRNLETLYGLYKSIMNDNPHEAVYVKQLYHMNAWIYETDKYIYLKSWDTVVAIICKANNKCFDFVDYIFHNILVEGFNDDNTYFYNPIWGYIPRKDTTNSSKRQVSRFASLYNAKTIAYKELS